MDKNDVEQLQERLVFSSETGWNDVDHDTVFDFADGYKEFLTDAKTERNAARYIIDVAEENGFQAIEDIDSLDAGDKVYAINRNKQVVMAEIGDDLFDDVRMTVSHLDSPRLDVKQNPLFEDSGLAMADTHYYGGIVSYQWFNIPLALYGTVVTAEGDSIDIAIGDDKEDPVVVVPDLLPHLGRDRVEKKLKEAIESEDLDIIVGNLPVDNDEAENAVKLKLLKHLEDEYDITEEDLISAEIEAVPALDPRDAGLDRSMVAAYGQDDKGLSYITLEALLAADNDATAIAWFFDKEEIGSEGNTSVQSAFLERFMATLLEKAGIDSSTAALYDVFDNTEALSTDVSAAVNPTYKEVHDTKNAINLGQGVALVKFTGSGGKYAANDAHAEFVGKIRGLLNENDIPYSPVELGKVGKGGGGTVAKYMARRGADVVDMGMSLLSMHSPYEVSSKVDLYYTNEACRVFFES